MGSSSTQVRPGVRLSGAAAAAVDWVGCTLSERAHFPRTSLPSEKIHASPWPTVCELPVSAPSAQHPTNSTTTFVGAICAPEATVGGASPYDRFQVCDAASYE